MNATTVLARTRAYVEESFLYMRPGFVLKDQDRLFEKGVIDSMGVVELVSFLEGEFGVSVRDDDISEENFGTLADIARYVTSRNGHGSASVSHLGNTR